MPRQDEEEEYSSDNSCCHSKRSELSNRCERREKRHGCKRCNKTESNKYEKGCSHCKCRRCKGEPKYSVEPVRENKCEQKKCVCGTSFVITIN